MRRRTFLQLGTGSIIAGYAAGMLSWLPTKHINLYVNRFLTPPSSLLFKQIVFLVQAFNEKSSTKINIVSVGLHDPLSSEASFISSPDQFNFKDTATSGFENLTFLGSAKTYQEKIRSIRNVEAGYRRNMERRGFSPVFLEIGPDLQADIVKFAPVKKYAVYDQKSYLFSQTNNATPVVLTDSIEKYLPSFHSHFDATAPLYYREFCDDNGLKISKKMISIDHYISPHVFTAFISNKDCDSLGTKNLGILRGLANDHISLFSQQVHNYIKEKMRT